MARPEEPLQPSSPNERIRLAIIDLRVTLESLRLAKEGAKDIEPTPRDVSIAITHIEDALLRLLNGTP